jgi:hypothetical protein
VKSELKFFLADKRAPLGWLSLQNHIPVLCVRENRELGSDAQSSASLTEVNLSGLGLLPRGRGFFGVFFQDAG